MYKFIFNAFALFIVFLSIIIFFNITPLYAAGGPSQSDPVTLDNPLSPNVSPQIFIGKIIKAALGVVGSLALLMFIYGGFTWMLSAGSADKVTKGKNILVWAAIGLAVIFSSYALVNFVFTSLGVKIT